MPPHSRLIRRKSLSSRLLSYVNPIDYLVGIYHYDWDGITENTAQPIALALNFLLLLARANGRGGGGVGGGGGGSGGRYGYGYGYDDQVLRTQSTRWGSSGGGGWWVMSWVLAALSVVNAVMCFSKKKRYRMFESNIDVEPSTPSAKRVNLNESPTSIPTQILNSFTPKKKAPSARSSKRGSSSSSHYDQGPEVWEISVWDPTPLALSLFRHYSPVHCAIYFLTFPLAATSTPTSSSPAATASKIASYMTIITIQVLLTYQIKLLVTSFTQQAHDKALIAKEVFHEYDTKYVHPRTSTIRRDVGVQCSDDHFEASVQVFTPVYNRMGYTIRPNPNFSPYTVIDSTGNQYGGAWKSPIPERPTTVKKEYGNGNGNGVTPRRGLFSTGREDGQPAARNTPLVDRPIKSEYASRHAASGGEELSRDSYLAAGVRERKRREEEEAKRRQQQRQRERGSDAFSTLYPDIDEQEQQENRRQPAAKENVHQQEEEHDEEDEEEEDDDDDDGDARTHRHHQHPQFDNDEDEDEDEDENDGQQIIPKASLRRTSNFNNVRANTTTTATKSQASGSSSSGTGTRNSSATPHNKALKSITLASSTTVPKSPFEETTFSPRKRPVSAAGAQKPFPVARQQSGAGGSGAQGMAGLVNMSVENSRSLSPSKMASPLKRGSRARGSTYAQSLGMGAPGTFFASRR